MLQEKQIQLVKQNYLSLTEKIDVVDEDRNLQLLSQHMIKFINDARPFDSSELVQHFNILSLPATTSIMTKASQLLSMNYSTIYRNRLTRLMQQNIFLSLDKKLSRRNDSTIQNTSATEVTFYLF